MAQLVLKQAPAPAPVPPSPADGPEAIAALCGKIVEGARRLGEFVARNRRLARERGLDVAAMQLQGIVDRERLDEVGKICSMGATGRKTMPVDPGLSTRLGNAERILDDASKEMARTDRPAAPASAADAELGQQEGGGVYWIPFAVIGAAVLGVVILMQSSKKKSDEPVKDLPFFERKK